ncbi:hypothetical protein ARMGADRAFT_1035906 [Armillaria gallica]|uniref:Uncharacterized protein n=1 Tax=Armillaria gallica TaxID=47427 RepID=A0A2H3DEK0_ARMGA|nr:hypothetical protein ARMGADRAFT_1035906 [Armillaria gallica]
MEYSGAVPPLATSSSPLLILAIDCDVVPPPPPRIVIPLTEQTFMKGEQCFDLNDSDNDDDDSLFFKQIHFSAPQINEQGIIRRPVNTVIIKDFHQTAECIPMECQRKSEIELPGGLGISTLQTTDSWAKERDKYFSGDTALIGKSFNMIINKPIHRCEDVQRTTGLFGSDTYTRAH